MSKPARGVTAEELFQFPDTRSYALVRGVTRVCELPGGVHGRVAARLAARLGDHVERLGLGTVMVEAGYVLQRAPDDLLVLGRAVDQAGQDSRFADQRLANMVQAWLTTLRGTTE